MTRTKREEREEQLGKERERKWKAMEEERLKQPMGMVDILDFVMVISMIAIVVCLLVF